MNYIYFSLQLSYRDTVAIARSLCNLLISLTVDFFVKKVVAVLGVAKLSNMSSEVRCSFAKSYFDRFLNSRFRSLKPVEVGVRIVYTPLSDRCIAVNSCCGHRLGYG